MCVSVLASMSAAVCISHILVYDALDLQRLHDVGDELRVSVGVSDLLVQQRPDAALRTQRRCLRSDAHKLYMYTGTRPNSY